MYKFFRSRLPGWFSWAQLLLWLLVVAQGAHSQSFKISGVVSTAGATVAYASVTFIDAADSSIRFSTVTDEFGGYLLSLSTDLEANTAAPTAFSLEQNVPNPFSSSTSLFCTLVRPGTILLTIYDVLGREVRRYTPEPQSPGPHSFIWDGRNDRGERLPPGAYFCRLHSGDQTMTRKMLFLPGRSQQANNGPTIALALARQSAGLSRRSKVLSSSYNIRIGNTDRTSPRIVPTEFSGVVLAANTVKNFYVAKYVPAQSATVQFNSPRQIIRGFGAANIVGWRRDMTAKEIATAFNTGDGQLGFTILRLRVPPDSNAFREQVPTARAASQLGALIIASPWSPPAWMKTNNSLIGGRLRQECYDDFARHLQSFVHYMASHSAPLYAISVQNEPDVSVTYESCDYNSEEMCKFMRENAANIGTRVMAPEGFNFSRILSDPILNDPVAAANLGMICGHIYGGGLAEYPLAREKGKEVWMTEHLVLETDWLSVLATGKEIHDCMVAGMNAYVWWYIVRYYGPIDENGAVTKRGTVMSHFARFVRPGYQRIEVTENPQPAVLLSAYREGAQVVIVALNMGTIAAEQPISFSDGVVQGFTPYVTTASKNCVVGSAISVGSGQCTVQLEPSSITTLVSQ